MTEDLARRQAQRRTCKRADCGHSEGWHEHLTQSTYCAFPGCFCPGLRLRFWDFIDRLLS